MRAARPHHTARMQLKNKQDLERKAMEIEAPEPMEEYVPGVTGGRNYMAKLTYFPGGPWSIAVIHVEALAPLHDSGRTWPTRDEAVQAAGKLVAELSH